MVMKRMLSATAVLVASFVFPISANAGPVVAWVFVAPTGNDSTCASQPSTNGAITPVPPLTVVPCKTFTRACALLPADAGNWVVEGFPGSFVEAAVCHASGHDPANPLQIIGRNPGAGNGGPLYLKSPDMRPAMEITGNFVYLNKIDFHGSAGDALYVHGTDSIHLAVDDVVGYNTSFDGNGGVAVHADYTYWFLMFGDNVYNNGANASSQGCMLFESSTFWLVTNTGITNCGSISGTPTIPKPGLVATKTIYGQYIANTAMHGASPNLQLNDSFNVLGVRDATKAAQQHFTYAVTSAKGPAEAAAELASDVFCGN
jgi:hypothetical protein